MFDKKNTFRLEILNKNLSRPDWTQKNHRSIDRIWLDKNE